MTTMNRSDSHCENVAVDVYHDLRAMANRRMANNSLRNSISPTSLLHESILKCGGWDKISEQKNKQLIQCKMAYAMRSVLVDRARRLLIEEEFLRQMPVGNQITNNSDADDLILKLDRALSKLNEIAPDACKIVHLKFFLNYSFIEIASLLEVSERTVRRYWAYGKAWLRVEMKS